MVIVYMIGRYQIIKSNKFYIKSSSVNLAVNLQTNLIKFCFRRNKNIPS